MRYAIEASGGPLAVLMLLALMGCGETEEPTVGQTEEGELVLGRSEVVERVPRAVSPGDRMLVFEGFNGTVRLDGTAEDVAQLVFVQRARGEDDAAAREVLRDVALEEQGDAGRYVFTMRSDQTVRSAVDVRGTVPQRTPLRVDYVSGAVALTGIDGPIEVEHQSGDVRIEEAAASVRVVIRNGDIAVGLRALPQGTDVALTTSNGDLTLTLPASASVQIDAETQVGAVRTQGLSFASQRLAPQGAGARFEAQLGDGNATVELRTENGAIVLRGDRATPPADTTAAPPADTAAAPADTFPPATIDTTTGEDTSAAPPDTTGA